MDAPFDLPKDNRSATTHGLLPIREVARQTGVNPVTLRAWERRYGLIVPLRTGKGHRLYSEDDVARIHLILSWLDRGVAVGQVKGLLSAHQEATLPSQPPESPWDPQRQRLLTAIGTFAERQLDEMLNAAMALYPPQTLYRQLLRPLLDALEQRWRGQPGGQAERVFLHSWLRTKLGARVYHNNRQCPGAPVLLVNATELPMAPDLWLCAWLISSSDCPVEVFDWPLPAAELAIAVANIQPRALLLYASHPGGQWPRPPKGLPCLLTGPAAALLQDTPETGIQRAESPLDALQALSERGLLHTR